MRTNLLRSAALAAAVALPFAATAAFAQSSSDLSSQSQANMTQPVTTQANPYGQAIVPDHSWNGFVHRTPEGVTHYGSEDYGFQGRSSQY